jgi:hypothetical protein
MSLPLFALILKPKDQQPVVRGVFTTRDKAKNHDPELRTGWTSGPVQGALMVNEGSLISYHEIRLIHANEELRLT